MGDKKRGKAVLKYIVNNFPRVNTIISVADGNLILAKEIYHYYKVSVYDPCIRNRNKTIRSHIKIRGKPFHSKCNEKCDLIVGLHPDEATGQIVDYSIRTKTPCLIIPCCVKGKYSNECRKQNWVKFLSNKLIQKGFSVSIDKLQIKGSNLAIKALPLHYKPPNKQRRL